MLTYVLKYEVNYKSRIRSIENLPSRAHGKGAVRGALGFSFLHSHLIGFNSHRSAEYFPYSIIPPNTRILVPSVAKPKAAHPVGRSPLING